MKEAWVNGRFDTGVNAYDGGWMGLGVFETLGVFAGAMPLWEAHLARLADGAAALGIVSRPPQDLSHAATELLQRNAASTAEEQDVLRISLTVGGAEVPTWCLTTRSRGPARPVRLEPVPFSPSATAAIKTTSRACYLLPLRAAQAKGGNEALLRDAAGCVLETTTGNVFVKVAGRWLTPPLDGRILPGVARAALLAALRADGVVVEEAPIDAALFEAREAICVTNAVWGPRPASVGAAAVEELDSRLRTAWCRAIS